MNYFLRKIFTNKKNKGFVLVEILITVALVSVVFITLLGLALSAVSISASIKKQTKADFLVKEGFETLRGFRDATTWSTNGLGVANTGSGSPYHIEEASGQWALMPGVESLEAGFSRKIIIDRVSRDATNNIQIDYVAQNDDPATRKITITVSWPEKSVEVVSYLTNWK